METASLGHPVTKRITYQHLKSSLILQLKLLYIVCFISHSLKLHCHVACFVQTVQKPNIEFTMLKKWEKVANFHIFEPAGIIYLLFQSHCGCDASGPFTQLKLGHLCASKYVTLCAD